MRGSFESDDEVEIEEILADPAASLWLKTALRLALERDPVDAANDAEVLYKVLARRCWHAFGWVPNSELG